MLSWFINFLDTEKSTSVSDAILRLTEVVSIFFYIKRNEL